MVLLQLNSNEYLNMVQCIITLLTAEEIITK